MLTASNTIRRKLLGNIFWLYSLQGLNYLVPLAVLPYLVRVLGVERYGLIAFAQAFAQYFVILTDYGFNLSATRRIALLRDDREQVSDLYWSVLLIKCVLMLLGAIVLAALVITLPRFRADALLYVIAYIAVLGSALFPIWLFQGMEQMRYISIVSGGAKVLSAVLLFVFVHQHSDYVIALAVQSGGLLLAGIAGFWIGISHFHLSYRRPSKAQLVQTLRDGWHLFVSNAAGTLYATTNVFLVGLVAGNTQAGFFSAAEKVIRSIQGMLGPTMQAIYPHVSGLAAKSRDAAIVFIRKSLGWIALLSFLPSALLLLFAHPIAATLFGKAADGAAAPLRWMAMLPFIIAVSGVFAIQTMIPFGMEKQLSRIYIVAAAASLLLSVPLIHRLGATGGAASVFIVETCIVLAMWNVLKQAGINLWPHAATSSDLPPTRIPKMRDSAFLFNSQSTNSQVPSTAKPLSIASVTVAYNGADVLRQHLKSLQGQTRELDEIVVVDNASTDNTRDLLAAEFPEITVLNLSENGGVGGGLSAGLAYAVLKKGHDWVWIFDQDSLPSPDALGCLLAGLEHLDQAAANTAILAPVCSHPESRLSYPSLSWQGSRYLPAELSAREPVTFVDMVISSGSLMRREAIEQAGLPRQDFFMDFVDYEHCLRLRRQGFCIAVVHDSRLDHAIGTPAIFNVFGRNRSWADHAPWREYYITRNEIFTIWRYYPRLATKAFVLRRVAQHAFGILLFGKQKLECFRMIWQGFLDGRAGRLGIRFLPGRTERHAAAVPLASGTAFARKTP